MSSNMLRLGAPASPWPARAAHSGSMSRMRELGSRHHRLGHGWLRAWEDAGTSPIAWGHVFCSIPAGTEISVELSLPKT
jgi:hypothetical protein